MDHIDHLAAKLRELAIRDTECSVFGASTFGTGHHYHLNPCLAPEYIDAFEAEFAIQLPDDYREFLTRVGNGGAGPYYGLYSLEQAVSDEPHHRSRAFLAQPFPLTEAFNPYSEGATDDEVFDDKYICGSIVLAHQGCGYYDRLVITGPQSGHVWTDARVSDQGLAPLNLSFYKWYEFWLIDSLASLL